MNTADSHGDFVEDAVGLKPILLLALLMEISRQALNDWTWELGLVIHLKVMTCVCHVGALAVFEVCEGYRSLIQKLVTCNLDDFSLCIIASVGVFDVDDNRKERQVFKVSDLQRSLW